MFTIFPCLLLLLPLIYSLVDQEKKKKIRNRNYELFRLLFLIPIPIIIYLYCLTVIGGYPNSTCTYSDS